MSKTISPEEVIKNGYSFIKTTDGRLVLVDKDYNILINDVQNQPQLHDWIDLHKLWNHPEGLVATHNYNHIRNSEGMKAIDDAVRWGGNTAGLFATTVALAPTALTSVVTYTPIIGQKFVKPFLKSMDYLFNPTTYHGGLLSSAVAANEINNFKNNPNIENGVYAGLSLLPFYPAVRSAISKTTNTAKDLYELLKYNPTSKLTYQPSITTFTPNPSIYYKSISVGNTYWPKQKDIFKYNAYLDSYFYTDKVKALIKQFELDGNLKTLQQSLKTLPEKDSEQLRMFLKTYNFQHDKVPYYDSLDKLLSDHPSLRRSYDSSPRSSKQDINRAAGVVIDNGEDYAVLIREDSQIDHEYEHMLQRKRQNQNGPYLEEQVNLLQSAYKHTDGDPITSLTDEKGAVNQQLRTSIINQFEQEFNRHPTVEEYQRYVDSIPDDYLNAMLNTDTNDYGMQYSSNNSDIGLIKQALKYIGISSVPLVFKNKE